MNGSPDSQPSRTSAGRHEEMQGQASYRRIGVPALARLLPVAVLAAVPILLYMRVCHFAFLNWDDQIYIIDNPWIQSLTVPNLRAILTPGTFELELLYIPVTYLSFMLEIAAFGLDAGSLHLTNVYLHAFNTILIFLMLQRLTRQPFPAFAAALLFAVHPLQVETVAWVMGRKDLLATCFSLMSILIWLRWMKTGSARTFAAVVLCVAAAALAKPTAVVVPVILVFVFWLERRRLELRPCLYVLPSVLVVAAPVLVAESVATMPVDIATFRLFYVPGIVCGWLSRFLLLDPPQAYYSLSQANAAANIVLLYFAPLALLALTAVVATRRRWWRLGFGLAFVVVAALPALSILCLMNREYVTADRYGYFSLIGMFMILSLPLGRCGSAVRAVYAGILVAWAAVAVLATHAQIDVWRNSESLWSHVLQLDPMNPTAHAMLGNHFYQHADTNRATYHLRRAVRVFPGQYRAYYNLGRIASESGVDKDAVRYYKRALAANPDFSEAWQNLGAVYSRLGAVDDAVEAYEAAIATAPNSAASWYNLGLVKKSANRLDEAREAFERAIAIDPTDVRARFKLAVVCHQTGRRAAARAAYERLVYDLPDHVELHFNLATIYLADGQPHRAVPLLNHVRNLQPADADIHRELGFALLGTGDFLAAIDALTTALNLTDSVDSAAHAGLCVAYYHQGNVAAAGRHYDRLREAGATSTVPNDIAAELATRRVLRP